MKLSLRKSVIISLFLPIILAHAGDDYFDARDMDPYLRRLDAAQAAISADGYLKALDVGKFLDDADEDGTDPFADVARPQELPSDFDLDRVIRDSLDHFFTGLAIPPTFDDIETLMALTQDSFLREKVAERAIPFVTEVEDIFRLITHLQITGMEIPDPQNPEGLARTWDAVFFAQKATPVFLTTRYSLNDARMFAKFLLGADLVTPLVTDMLKRTRNFRQFREVLALMNIPNAMAETGYVTFSSGRYVSEALIANAPHLLEIEGFQLTALADLERDFLRGFDEILEFRERLVAHAGVFSRTSSELQALTTPPYSMTEGFHLKRMAMIQRAVSRHVPLQGMPEMLARQIMHPEEPAFFSAALDKFLAAAKTDREFSRTVNRALSGQYSADVKELTFSIVARHFSAFLAMEKDRFAAHELMTYVGDTPSGRSVVLRYLRESVEAKRRFASLREVESLVYLPMSLRTQFGSLTDFAVREIVRANLPGVMAGKVTAAEINALVALPAFAADDREAIFTAYVRAAVSRKALRGLKLPFRLSPKLRAAVLEKIPACAVPLMRFLPVYRRE